MCPIHVNFVPSAENMTGKLVYDNVGVSMLANIVIVRLNTYVQVDMIDFNGNH